MQKQNNVKLNIYKLSFSAICIALAFLCRMFLEFMVPFFGANSIRISVEDVFLALPAMLFGGIYGGVCYLIIDILGVIFKPQGAFIPYLTIVFFIGGFLRGFLFKKLSLLKKFINKIYIVVAGLLFIFGTVNIFVKQSNLFLWLAPIFMGVILVAILLVLKLINKNSKTFKIIFLMQFIAGCFVSVATSVILYILLIAGKKGFYIFSFTRLIEAIALAIVTSVLITIIYKKVRVYFKNKF